MMRYRNGLIEQFILGLLAASILVSLPNSVQAATTATATPTIRVSTCPFKTANHVTHGLPQQCLRTYETGSNVTLTPSTTFAVLTDVAVVSSPFEQSTSLSTSTSEQGSSAPKEAHIERSDTSISTAQTSIIQSVATESSITDNTILPSDDPDSPLDTANFLSFEEWKAQNLAKAGQSVENIGGKAVREPRKRPGSISALDALGEDAEIELDFGDNDASVLEEGGNAQPLPEKPAETVAPESHARSKDAGKTCKERFNYASFDCAATVHKSNPEAKGGTAILVENKDSYMLNKCGAQNKFTIIELCDDILVDTVVLANYEFFSSMFRTFRVSVSDRYPVKSSGWKEVGFYEAKNSREIQAFLVENPLIWARYLRIEFLTHYGNEYYCPLSLLRVHGTTMMEEFRHQEELARGEVDDESEDVQPEAVDTSIAPILREESIDRALREEVIRKQAEHEQDGMSKEVASPTKRPAVVNRSETILIAKPTTTVYIQSRNTVQPFFLFSEATRTTEMCLAIHAKSYVPISTTNATTTTAKVTATSSTSQSTTEMSSSSKIDVSTTRDTRSTTVSRTVSSSGGSPVRSSNSTASEARKTPLSSSTQPSIPTPTTQESFFKTVHKRLQLLEANATLSLQYIEEQSRLLQEAFSKMEKRQLSKAYANIEQLNSTVVKELRGFKEQYDQLWQSTVIALEMQKELSEREMVAVSTRLTILADEVIFQKRMSIIQSVLLVVAIGLVIFSKSSYSTLRSTKSTYLALESPSASPPPLRKPHMRNDSNSPMQGGRYISHQRQSSDISLPEYDYSSPVADESYTQETDEDENKTRFIAIQSSPATPSGLHSANNQQVSWASDLDDAFSHKHLNVVHDQSKRWSVPNIRSDYTYSTEPDVLIGTNQPEYDEEYTSADEVSSRTKEKRIEPNDAIADHVLELPEANGMGDSYVSSDDGSDLPPLLRTSTR